jgi:hypothetical protein
MDAFVEGEEGQTTRRLVEQSEAAELEIRRTRRVWRTFFLACLIALLYAGWQLFNIGSEQLILTQAYDPAVGLDLELLGCDVDFVAGAAPTVSYAALWKAASARWQKHTSSPSIVRYGYMGNTLGCAGLRPGVGCRRRCLVTITVPPTAVASAAFRIDQDPDDLDAPRVTLRPGLELLELAISPRRVPHALSLVIAEAMVRGRLTGKLGFGRAEVRNSVIPDQTSLVTVYSIYVLGTSTVGGPASASAAAAALPQPTTAPSCRAFGLEMVDKVDVLGGLQSTGEGEIVLTAPGFVPSASQHPKNRGGGDHRDDGGSNYLPTPRPVLAPTDADRLSKAYGTLYGDRQSTGSGYLIFDVVGSVGVPHARFIYATSPFFLLLDPAVLKFLTAGVLMPKVHIERLHFSGFSCELGIGETQMGPATRNATLAAMSDEITKALRSDPEDDRPLRGVVVLTADERLPLPWAWNEPRLLHFPNAAVVTRPERWRNESIQTLIRYSLGLCALVGLLFGGAILTMIHSFLQRKQHDLWMKDEANIKYLFLCRYRSEADRYYLAARKGEGDARAKPGSNPFAAPFQLLTKLTMREVRRGYVDSLAAFVERTMVNNEYRDEETSRHMVATTLNGNQGNAPAQMARKVEVATRWQHIKRGASMSSVEEGLLTEPFIYMADLMRHYEVFCIEQELAKEPARNVVQRRLVTEFGARVRMIHVSRLYGLKWSEHVRTSMAAAPKAVTGKADSAAVVRAFIDTCCQTDPDEFIDLATRPGPDGLPDIGFKPAMEEWCKAHEMAVPTFEWAKPAWAARALPEGCSVKLNMTARQVRGLSYAAKTNAITFGWYVFEGLTVLVHSFVLYVPPLMWAVYTMSAQNYFALFICPPSAPSTAPADRLHPLTWLDVFSSDPWDADEAVRHSSLVSELIIHSCTGFIALTMLHQALVYLDLPTPPEVKEGRPIPWYHTPLWLFQRGMSVFKVGFSVILAAFLLLSFAFLGVLGVWFLLATAMDPSAFLPYGVGAVTCITVVMTLWHQLNGAAVAIRAVMQTAFFAVMRKRLEDSGVVLAEADTSHDAPDDSKGGRGGGGGGEEGGEESNEEGGEEGTGDGAEEEVGASELQGVFQLSAKVTPEELFALGDTKGDGQLDMVEFTELFRKLQLGLGEAQMERLFALCDIDCNGTISREEFVRSWDLVIDDLLDDGAESVGLGRVQIVFIVVYTLIFLGIVIAFVLVTLAAWANEDKFGAVVQSLLVAGAGKTSTSARTRGEAEDPEKVDDIVEGFLEQKQADNDEG